MTINIEKKLEPIKKSVIVCIPAYNEEKNIAKLLINTKKYSNKIIVIDDGSSDYTSKIAKELGVDVLIHKKNYGKSAALKTGFKHAMNFSPDVIVTIDGDGQHDPSSIPNLIEPIINGEVDIVIGSRSKKTKMPKYRKIGYDAISFMNRKAINSKIRDTQSGFRAYSNKSINAIAQERYDDYAGEFEQLGTLTQKGFEIKEVEVDIKYDGLKKTSKKNFISHGGELILASLFMIIARRPILYLAMPGTFLLLIGFFYAFYTLFLFNAERYFSIPMSVLSGGLVLIGSLLILSSMFIFIISKMQNNVRE